MPGPARRLVVGRLRKPHGLKGDCAVFPLTDDPEAVFAPGRTVWVIDLAGEPVGEPLVIHRARPYHREWLVAFRGRESRSGVEGLGGRFLAVPAGELTPPEGDEVYLAELPGFAVQHVDGRALGLVTAWYELPAGLALEVQGPKREFLLPYRKEIVRSVDRAARRLVVEPPEGLIELE
ncbi:MAG TPA: ribosome maturation factor RimM [Gemmatimonadales bacterium]|nr:ribosome maturation factor RimM [Gemmatimonadales bacterium]